MLGRVLTRLFALFGMTLTCVACYGVPEAEYNPNFAATGRVVDPEGRPIKGIEAKIGMAATHTDEDGHFRIRGNVSTLVIRDVDGEENGGLFESRTIDIISGDEEVGEVVLNRISEEE